MVGEGIQNQLVRKSIGDILGTEAGEMDDRDEFHTRELKRQKKLDYGLSDAVLQRLKECKSKEDKPVIPSIGPCDASNMNGSVCSFCHSSKITERSGSLLHYADGKEVSRDEIASSKAIPVRSKCIEW